MLHYTSIDSPSQAARAMSESPERDPSDPAEADDPTLLWRRIHEHKMVQWTIAYVAIAYGIQHAVTLTAEALEWPHAIERATMILLILGVPVMLTLAWYHGARASRRFSAAEATIVSLLLVTISILFFVFVQPSAEITGAPSRVQQASITTAPGATEARQSSVAAARQASLSPATAVSLAVMPFENLSPDPSQAYFSDGMTQEIISALAKIPDLRVVARESAFAFKGKDQDVRAIGRALGATHLIEGSVRKAGGQLRISAELVRADTGVTIWANSYDRKLDDVFAIQEDIARAIATSLHMTLGLKPGENLVNARTNQAAYDAYLSARTYPCSDI
jgi:adenylate cyclase